MDLRENMTLMTKASSACLKVAESIAGRAARGSPIVVPLVSGMC
jgi:hypothetical protein